MSTTLLTSTYKKPNWQYVEIGETAGKIYRELEKNGEQATESVRKEIGLQDAALFNQALGWLAREGKVNFQKKGANWQIALQDQTSGVCCQQ